MAEPNEDAEPRRPYDSPVRRERKAQTRDRIVEAGTELVRQSQDWQWQEITCDLVASHAGVARRTVFRHFATERDLHAAILNRLSEQAGVDYTDLTLDDVADTANRVFRSLGSFAAADTATPATAAVIQQAGLRRREALLRAIAHRHPEMSAGNRTKVAAALDVLWNTSAYALLIDAWQLSHRDAETVLTWAINIIIGGAED